MKIPLATSALLGVAWAFLAVYLLGGFSGDTFPFLWIIPGIGAGIVAGYSVIWGSRRGWGYIKRGFLSYYSGIVGYGILLFIVLRVQVSMDIGIWSTFDLSDHFSLLPVMLIYGTFPYGLFLIPLGFLSAFLVHWIYTRQKAEPCVPANPLQH